MDYASNRGRSNEFLGGERKSVSIEYFLGESTKRIALNHNYFNLQ